MPSRPASTATSAHPRPVLLIHGIWNSRLWLSPLASKLRTMPATGGVDCSMPLAMTSPIAASVAKPAPTPST